MSRSLGGTSFTSRSPIHNVPAEIDSSPAIIRRVVLFPHPDGPTRTTNSPSRTSRSTPCTATWLLSPYTFRSPSSFTRAIPGASRSPSHDRADPLSGWFSLGRRDVGVPDRRIAPRRRRGGEHLAPVRPFPRPHHQRRHR